MASYGQREDFESASRIAARQLVEEMCRVGSDTRRWKPQAYTRLREQRQEVGTSDVESKGMRTRWLDGAEKANLHCPRYWDQSGRRADEPVQMSVTRKEEAF